MNKRIIFCDFDGVLNSIEYLLSLPKTHQKYQELDLKKVMLLKYLCSQTGAKIVLTSSWRDDLKTRKWLKTRCELPVIGATPHKHDRRDLEIHQWILDSHFDGQYIILDDECSTLNEIQMQHLILTREPKTPYPRLGLQPKHLLWARAMFQNENFNTQANTQFIACILMSIMEDWLRVMGNIYQRDFDNENPWQNTGNVKGYKNDTFEVHAYDWGWDYDEDSKKPQPINFKWRDLEITWYKWYGRGLATNRPTTHDELALMLDECLKSLDEEDKLYD